MLICFFSPAIKALDVAEMAERKINQISISDVEKKITQELVFGVIKQQFKENISRDQKNSFFWFDTYKDFHIPKLLFDNKGELYKQESRQQTSIMLNDGGISIEASVVMQSLLKNLCNIQVDQADRYFIQATFSIMSELITYYREKKGDSSKEELGRSNLLMKMQSFKEKHLEQFSKIQQKKILKFINDYSELIGQLDRDFELFISDQKEKEKKEETKKIVLAIIAVLIGVPFAFYIWNKFFRTRCPECKSTKYTVANSHEIDRWIGKKKVPAKKGPKGQIRYKYINATFVKIQNDLCCDQCGCEWAVVKKRELK